MAKSSRLVRWVLLYNLSKEVAKAKDTSLSQLLKVNFCRICGSKLNVKSVDGKKVLKCAEHGEMKVYLEHDPLAFAEACDDFDIINLETLSDVV